MKTKLFITGLAFFAITSLGFSQGNPQDKPGRNQGGNQPAWVDENKNGICDNYENRTPGQGRGKGYCSGRGQGFQGRGMMNGQGRGRFFIDENKNGVCDRYEENQKDQADKK